MQEPHELPLFHHNYSDKNIYVKGIAADTERSGKYGFKKMKIEAVSFPRL